MSTCMQNKINKVQFLYKEDVICSIKYAMMTYMTFPSQIHGYIKNKQIWVLNQILNKIKLVTEKENKDTHWYNLENFLSALVAAILLIRVAQTMSWFTSWPLINPHSNRMNIICFARAIKVEL